MKILLIATHNPAKIKELALGLKPLREKGIKLVTLEDLGITDEPEETGNTFEDNALLKAKYYSLLTRLPTISDDGGIVIEALSGEPGVKSKMWLGGAAPDEGVLGNNFEKVKGKANRKAYLETCICFYDLRNDNVAQRTTFAETERIYGRIADAVNDKRSKGFPFRALFIVDEYNKYYDELTGQEHESINHRLKALKRLATKIEQYLLQ